MLKANNNWEKYLLGFLIITLLCPVWYFQFYIVDDGPSHVANSVNFMRLLTGECPLVAEYYKITFPPPPNYLSNIFLGLLSQIIPPVYADKVIISLYLILFPIAIWKLIKSINPDNGFLVIIAFIFTLSAVFYYGLYNFLFSVIIYFFALIWWFKNRDNYSYKAWLILFAIFALLYLSHPLGLAFMCLSIAAIVILDIALKWDRFLINFKSALFSASAASPFLILLAWHLSTETSNALLRDDFFRKLIETFMFSNMITTLSEELLLMRITSSIFALCVILYSYYRIRERKKLQLNDYPLIIAVALIYISLISPVSIAGGWLITIRYQLIIYIMLLCWLANIRFNPYVKIFISILAIVIFACSYIPKLKTMEQINKLAQQRSNAWQYIPANSTYIELDLSIPVVDYKTGKSIKRQVLPHFTSYISANQCSVQKLNFHAMHPYIFPIVYKDKNNTTQVVKDFVTSKKFLFTLPKSFSIKDYPDTDYFIIYGDIKFSDKHPSHMTEQERAAFYQKFMNELNENYNLHWHSEDNTIKIYKRR